jgi:hypothetical protein
LPPSGRRSTAPARRPRRYPSSYDEFGVQSTVPPAKADLYSGTEQPNVHPVSLSIQAAYHRRAIALAFCQPNVSGIFLFLIADSPNLADWQSGLYYPDGTPKPALAGLRAAAAEVRRGVIARCPGLHLRVQRTVDLRRHRPRRCRLRP